MKEQEKLQEQPNEEKLDNPFEKIRSNDNKEIKILKRNGVTDKEDKEKINKYLK